MAGSMGIDGLVTGFKTSEVVSKLIELEKAPLYKLTERRDSLKTKADAWRELNSRLYKLKDAAYALQSFENFRSRKLTVEDDSLFTATCDNTANVADYKVKVLSLAQAHSMVAENINVADADTNLGRTGSININIDGVDHNIAVADGDSLNDIAKKINEDEDLGVNASVIKMDDGNYALTLTSQETGLDNAMTITENLVDGGGNPANFGFVEKQAAKDAQIEINGLTVNRSSNKIDDVIEGVTLNLLKAQDPTAEPTNLKVEVDKDKIVEAVKGFVDAYNSVMDYIAQNKEFTYDEETKKGSAGPLFGDYALSHIDNALREYMSMTGSGVAEEVNMLSLIGIEGIEGVEGAKSGKLEFDEELFRSKLDSNFDDVANLFGATSTNYEDGIFYNMQSELFDMTSSTGFIKAQSESLDKRINDFNNQIESWEERLERREDYLYRKFTAMEVAIAKLQNQGSWIQSQIAGLSGLS